MRPALPAWMADLMTRPERVTRVANDVEAIKDVIGRETVAMSVEVHELPNGLRLAVEPMPGLRSATVGVFVTAGGRHERLEQNGIAHFLEHMAFKGTPTRTARAIAEEIEDVGGYINAYTGKEMTAYYARVLEADVERALGILADIVLEPALRGARHRGRARA